MSFRIAHPAVIMLLLLTATAGSALAEDISPPEWRGLPNSTLQIWEFSTGDHPVPPDMDQNPFGTAEAEVYGEFNFPLRDTWWVAEREGREGLWAVGGSMSLWIPNAPVERTYKQIRIQLVYDGGGDRPVITVVPSEGPVVAGTDPIETALDDRYTHAVYDLVLEPNPFEETIWIQPGFCEVYIDEIVIDTICVPEPSSFVLLGMGAIGLLVWVRRKRSVA